MTTGVGRLVQGIGGGLNLGGNSASTAIKGGQAVISKIPIVNIFVGPPAALFGGIGILLGNAIGGVGSTLQHVGESVVSQVCASVLEVLRQIFVYYKAKTKQSYQKKLRFIPCL